MDKEWCIIKVQVHVNADVPKTFGNIVYF